MKPAKPAKIWTKIATLTLSHKHPPVIRHTTGTVGQIVRGCQKNNNSTPPPSPKEASHSVNQQGDSYRADRRRQQRSCLLLLLHHESLHGGDGLTDAAGFRPKGGDGDTVRQRGQSCPSWLVGGQAIHAHATSRF